MLAGSEAEMGAQDLTHAAGAVRHRDRAGVPAREHDGGCRMAQLLRAELRATENAVELLTILRSTLRG